MYIIDLIIVLASLILELSFLYTIDNHFIIFIIVFKDYFVGFLALFRLVI